MQKHFNSNMAKNINIRPFDEATKLKLKIFGECFKEWLPVFIQDRHTEQVYIYDFFAGSGTDIEGSLGSPLILLDEAKGENRKYCIKATKNIAFTFNDVSKKKSIKLQHNIDKYIADCEIQNQCNKCVYEYKVCRSNFKSIFQDNTL